MPDDQKPQPWERVKPAWEAANPRIPANEAAYRKLVSQNLGDYVRTDAQGRNIYRRSDGTEVFDFGKVGPYSRRQQNTKLPGTGDIVDYPLADIFRSTDNQVAQGNPWIPYGNNEQFDLTDRSVDGRLRRAALAQRYQQTHEPSAGDKAKVADLQYANQIYSDLSKTLGKVKDSDIGNGARLGAAVLNMSAEDLAKHGISPAYVQLIGQLERARAAGISVPGTATAGQISGAPEHPLSQFIASDPITAGILAVGGNVYDFLKNSQNLTRLRTLVPQQLNETRKEIYDTVKGDPEARWSSIELGYGNKAAEEAEKEFSHSDNPLSTEVSKPVPEPVGTTPAATPTPTPGTTQQPSASDQVTTDVKPTETATPPVEGPTAQEKARDELKRAGAIGMHPFVQTQPEPGTLAEKVKQVVGNVEPLITSGGIKLPNTSSVTFPTEEPPEVAAARLGRPVHNAPISPPAQQESLAKPAWEYLLPSAPIVPKESGAPTPWARYGTSLEGMPGPSFPAASAEERQPGGGAENAEIGSFADTPRLALQEHVDQLPAGTRFTWHHDGQEYVKT